MSASLGALARTLTATFPGTSVTVAKDGIERIDVPRDSWRAVATAAVAGGFDRFLDLTAVDDPRRADRFELLLLVYSFGERRWLRIATRTADRVDSITPVFAAADWYEREVYDLFGVDFAGHPGLCRIVLPDDYPTHPLRRDHPLGDIPVDFTVTRPAAADGERPARR